MKNQIITARITLTLFYTLTILLLGVVISGLFYFRTSQVLEAEYDRIERRIQMESSGFPLPIQGNRLGNRRIHAEDLDRAKYLIVSQLIRINLLIVVVVAIAGYILSGKTLKPIQQSMEEQQQFVGDAAHELKTPLTALKTSLEVSLMDSSITGSYRQLLKENLKDVENLSEMTSNLLSLARFNDHTIKLKKVDLSLIVTDATKRILPIAQIKKITINTKTISKKVFVMGDSTALTELFMIVLDNAVKYSPSKSVVTVDLFRNKRMVDITIADQGIGIEKEHISHIFKRFYQVDPARSKNGEGGYGLGLAIASSIAAQHNGKITVKSILNKGSIFTISLPAVQS